MSGSSSRKRPLLARRSFIKGMITLTSSWSLLVLPRVSFGWERHSIAQMKIITHCPGGEVEIILTNTSEPMLAVLEVRRGEAPARCVDKRTITANQSRCRLWLDLPEPHWTPGTYMIRTRLLRDQEELVWESSWQHGFTLRHLPWEG